MTYDDNFILDRLYELGDYIEIFKDCEKWCVGFRFGNKRYMRKGRTLEEAVLNAVRILHDRHQLAEEEKIYYYPYNTPNCSRCKGHGLIPDPSQVIVGVVVLDRHDISSFPRERLEYHLKQDAIRQIQLIECPDCIGTGRTGRK